jgi:hypothetical protein
MAAKSAGAWTLTTSAQAIFIASTCGGMAKSVTLFSTSAVATVNVPGLHKSDEFLPLPVNEPIKFVCTMGIERVNAKTSSGTCPLRGGVSMR